MDKCAISKTWNYSDLERNEVLIPHTMWMNFQNNMLSKSNQAQSATYCTEQMNLQGQKAEELPGAMGGKAD